MQGGQMFPVLWVVFAVAVGVLADKRGRGGVKWFFIALVVSPLIAGVFLLVNEDLAAAKVRASLQPDATTHVRCPACAEWVMPEAAVCKHCGHALVPDKTFHERQADAKKASERKESSDLLVGVGTIVGLFVIAYAIQSCTG